MSEYIPTREEAFELLKEYNKNESLIKHALAVEGGSWYTLQNYLVKKI